MLGVWPFFVCEFGVSGCFVRHALCGGQRLSVTGTCAGKISTKRRKKSRLCPTFATICKVGAIRSVCSFWCREQSFGEKNYTIITLNGRTERKCHVPLSCVFGCVNFGDCLRGGISQSCLTKLFRGKQSVADNDFTPSRPLRQPSVSPTTTEKCVTATKEKRNFKPQQGTTDKTVPQTNNKPDTLRCFFVQAIAS